MGLIGKKLEPDALQKLRATLVDFRQNGLESPHAEAILAHADWLQAELDRHVALATAQLDKRGIRIETLKSERSAIGWEVIVSDPKNDEKREVDVALNLVLMLAGVWHDMRSRQEERALLRAVVGMLQQLGKLDAESLVGALDYLDRENADGAAWPSTSGRLTGAEKKERALHRKLARLESEAKAIRAVLTPRVVGGEQET